MTAPACVSSEPGWAPAETSVLDTPGEDGAVTDRTLVAAG